MLKSTMHLSKTEKIRSKAKLEVIMYHTGTKGGVNNINQLVRGYSTKRIKHWWQMAIFYNIVDFSALNALMVYLSLNYCAFRSRTRPAGRNLLIQLGKDLEGYANQLRAPLLDIWVISMIYHLAFHKANDVTSVQVKKTKKI